VNDPVDDLAHDHLEINQQVLELARMLQSSSTQELFHVLAALRDILFLHFALEEEALFPYVAEAVPELATQVQHMEIAHDTICGTLARMIHLASSGGAVAGIASLFERFQLLYAEHASAEAQLLKSLDHRLDRKQREYLSALVAGL
jgi:iron-sulfur cluster repair protein YtfE (RIC family)